jgi:hypothetical protein
MEGNGHGFIPKPGKIRHTIQKNSGTRITVSKPILGYSEIVFLQHAKDQMKKRAISEAQVLEVFRNPTRKNLPTQPGRFRWRKWHSTKRSIDVVFEKLTDQLCIVTAIDVENE